MGRSPLGYVVTGDGPQPIVDSGHPTGMVFAIGVVFIVSPMLLAATGWRGGGRWAGWLPIAEEERVVARTKDRVTHQAEFMGEGASGRLVTTTWIEIFLMESGKAVEGWLEADIKKLLEQMSP
jgi:SnoaL-like polyketide cyclase